MELTAEERKQIEAWLRRSDTGKLSHCPFSLAITCLRVVNGQRASKHPHRLCTEIFNKRGLGGSLCPCWDIGIEKVTNIVREWLDESKEKGNRNERI
jgi:hypothetical protein